MYKEVIKWLRIQQMPVAESHLRLRLESHPDYPSLIAVQDTLEELGINSYACSGTKEELKKENKPFLAHFNTGGGDVQFFKDINTAEQKIKDFDKLWSGNVMFAEPTEKYGNADHDKLHKKEKLNSNFGIAAITLFAGALLGVAITAGSVPAVLLIISNCIGLYFSWLIAQKEFGISNSISDKICSMAKHSRCESVLFSKGAKLFNWLTWGDVGIVYFTSSLLYLLISLLTNQLINLNLYYLLSLAGIVFPLYSLYYQWKVVKQWCMLCIGVLAVLGINAIISFTEITNAGFSLNSFSETAKAIIILATISILILTVWQLIKSLYQKSLSSLSNEIKATGLKRKPEIFNALLQQQTINPINLPEADEAIRFGNPAAPFQIVIACNPYCGPCAKAHQAIENVFSKYPQKINVAVRFVIYDNNINDKKASAVIKILKATAQKPHQAIKDWYMLRDIEKFGALYGENGINVEGFLLRNVTWSKSQKIRSTPSFFLNGKKIPDMYSWYDLFELVEKNIQDR